MLTWLFPQTALAYARVWHHVDASERVLGKLAERIAIVLMGKHKPIYDPGCMCIPIYCEHLLIDHFSQLTVATTLS